MSGSFASVPHAPQLPSYPQQTTCIIPILTPLHVPYLAGDAVAPGATGDAPVPARGRRVGSAGQAAAAADTVRTVLRRVNIMGGPLGKDEEEKSSEEAMSTARKQQIIHRALDALNRMIDEKIKVWVEAGRDTRRPPTITNASGGCEIGEKFGKLHLQLTFETFVEKSEKEETTRKRLKAEVAEVLAPLLNTGAGESWPLKAKMIPKVGERAKGGWLYQLIYAGHKESGPHAYVFKNGLDKAACDALGVHHLDTCWEEAVAIHTKFASNGKGAAGKKEWKQIAAIVSGRTAGHVQIIDKTSSPGLILKFSITHDIAYLDLDPLTIETLMLAAGNYGLGTTTIATSHGGTLSSVRFAAFMRLMSNGLLGACRFLLCQIHFGTDDDAEARRLFALNRSPLLPSIEQCMRMTLDELKALKSTGMAVPRRLQCMRDSALDPTAPAAVVLDMSAGLEPKLVVPEASSFTAAKLLHESGANVNPCLLSANDHGDADGSFAAAYAHSLLQCASKRGLLTFRDADCYHHFTDGTKKLAEVYTAGREFPDVPQRISYLLDEMLRMEPVELEWELSFHTSLDALRALSTDLPLESSKLYLHIVVVQYETTIRAGEQRQVAHHYVVAYWPGHSQHVFSGTSDTYGSAPLSALWPAFRAATSVAAAGNLLLQHAPEEFFRNGGTLLKNKAAQLQLQLPKRTEQTYALSDFTVRPLRLDGKAVVLSGNAGIGKTCFAEAHAKHAKVLKTLDDLRSIPGECDLLIFDDMRFDSEGLDLTPEMMITLLDVKRMGSIKCRHYDGVIPCLPRIFTTNRDPHNGESIFPKGSTEQQERAIRRRFRAPLFLTQSLFAKTPTPDLADSDDGYVTPIEDLFADVEF